jgi:hypothetical protein
MSGNTRCNSRREIFIRVIDEAKIACRLIDLKVLPSNRLEKLSGGLKE